MRTEKWPREYAAEARALATHQERKQYVESVVPEKFRDIVITYLKINLMWDRHNARIKQQKAKKKPVRKVSRARQGSRGKSRWHM